MVSGPKDILKDLGFDRLASSNDDIEIDEAKQTMTVKNIYFSDYLKKANRLTP